MVGVSDMVAMAKWPTLQCKRALKTVFVSANSARRLQVYALQLMVSHSPAFTSPGRGS